MPARKLHIVSFDVPYPADYGGAIDVYYKIKALAEAGTEIYLHCFQYGRPQAAQLAQLCRQVWYYPRLTGIRGLSVHLPYIVNSRRNALLLQRLNEIDAPILFEGIHTTFYLSHPSLSKRFKAIRAHNVEHDYYRQLAAKEPDLFKRMYYRAEAGLLQPYEANLGKAQAFFSLSAEDDKYFASQYPSISHAFIAPFQPYNQVVSLPGLGGYTLYHGNLAHGENIEAAFFLLREVFSKVNVPLVIAGRDPVPDLVAACNKLANCRLVVNPGIDEMEELVRNAQVHILPTFQQSGMKLKLLYALFSGRHVLVNSAMLHGTGLNNCCSIADNAQVMADRLKQLMETPFTDEDIARRSAILSEQYDNARNAQRLLTFLQR
ncbi:MAG: glycosyltransferase [Bacteroidetes bacterium]|nr:glycosyltransferase [Bacteroidota bacterium]